MGRVWPNSHEFGYGELLMNLRIGHLGTGSRHRVWCEAAHTLVHPANLLFEKAPATSMVEVSRLIDPAMLVEIEADALLAED